MTVSTALHVPIRKPMLILRRRVQLITALIGLENRILHAVLSQKRICQIRANADAKSYR